MYHFGGLNSPSYVDLYVRRKHCICMSWLDDGGDDDMWTGGGKDFDGRVAIVHV